LKQAESCGGGRRNRNRSGRKKSELSYFEGNVVWLEVRRNLAMEISSIQVDLGPGFIPLK